MSYFDAIVATQHDCCFYCEHRMIRHRHEDGVPTPPDAATKDHFIPRVYGGKTHASNIVAACRLCNNLRGEMEAEAFRNLLRKWFKRDPFLWIRWHNIDVEEYADLRLRCIQVYERQLRGIARRHRDVAYVHRDFTWRERHRLGRI